MRRLFLLGALLGAAACPSTVNQDSCHKYVDTLNALPCRDKADADAMCPQSFDADGAASCSEFFDCLSENAHCDGDVYVADAEKCDSCEVK